MDNTLLCELEREYHRTYIDLTTFFYGHSDLSDTIWRNDIYVLSGYLILYYFPIFNIQIIRGIDHNDIIRYSVITLENKYGKWIDPACALRKAFEIREKQLKNQNQENE